MPLSEEQETQFEKYFSEFVTQAKMWKKEWLKENPPTELVHHLTNPAQNTERRQKQWDQYLLPRANAWWKERGWKVVFGLPHEECSFTPYPQTEKALT